MENSYYFVVAVPSEHGNICYEAFDKSFLKFATKVLKGTIIKKNTNLCPFDCMNKIAENRHELGPDQKLQLIADKLLNMAEDAKSKNLIMKISFVADD